MGLMEAEAITIATSIVAAGQEQLPELLAIDRQCFESEVWSEKFWRDLLSNPHRYRIWLLRASQSHEVIGYAVFSCVLDESELLRIGIAPYWRGHHLGAQLLAHAQLELFGDGTELLFLEVRKSNVRAQSLYGSLGWERHGSRRDYYPTADGFEDAFLFTLARN